MSPRSEEAHGVSSTSASSRASSVARPGQLQTGGTLEARRRDYSDSKRLGYVAEIGRGSRSEQHVSIVPRVIRRSARPVANWRHVGGTPPRLPRLEAPRLCRRDRKRLTE